MKNLKYLILPMVIILITAGLMYRYGGIDVRNTDFRDWFSEQTIITFIVVPAILWTVFRLIK